MRSSDRGGRKLVPVGWRAVDWLLVFALGVALLFPLLATLSVADAGIPPPRPEAALPPLRRAPTAPLRQVPVFTAGGAAESAVLQGAVLADPDAMEAALVAANRELFGEAAGTPLEEIVRDRDLKYSIFMPAVGTAENIPYPFRYLEIDPFLDGALPGVLEPAQAAAASDYAGLLTLAAAHFGGRFPNAAPTAFALLDRARAGDDCLPQLNLALLLSTDLQPRDDDVALEFERAAEACSGDPTPLWLLGQFQSMRAYLTDDELRLGQDIPIAERVRRPFETFRRLQEELPGSAAGWSGQADAELRLAYQGAQTQPFTARNRFRRALVLYRRAAVLDGDPAHLHGQARAYSGLGLHDRAVVVQRRALEGNAELPSLQVRLVEYLERGHHFAEAAESGAEFLEQPAVPPPAAGLLARAKFPFGSVALQQDADGPLSLGTDRLQPVTLLVGPPPGGAGAGVIDVSFIPTFRQIDAVTGFDPWCRDWSRRRDLVLAGHPDEALADFPEAFFGSQAASPAATVRCEEMGFLLAAVAAMESGDLQGSYLWVQALLARQYLDLSPYGGDLAPESALVFDARQELWRFAGDFERAAAVIEEWLGHDPSNELALDRLGEVEFLRGDYAAAARAFAEAAASARSSAERTLMTAQALLKRGTALELDGRLREALPVLAEADRLASEVAAAGDECSGGTEPSDYADAIVVSYHARTQSGDTELRARNYAKASAHYRLARERQGEVLEYYTACALQDQGPRLLRPEVLENNQALVEIQLHHVDEALRAASAAVAADPESPIFLQTLGFAEQEAGHLERAADAYAAAVAADPTLFPAANDLGAVLAKLGRDAEAAEAFRRAVGVEPKYAIAWFNLGIALTLMGPAHVLESEGAFARAAGLDRSLQDREREVIFDNDPYFTGLDLSRPLPAEWSFAQSQERTPLAVSGLVALLFLLGLARAVSTELIGSGASERFLKTDWSSRFGWLRALGRPLAPWVAVAVTAAVFLWPLLRSEGPRVTGALLLGAGVVVLVGVYVRVRTLAAARHGRSVRHYSWTPALAFGAVATVAGAGWAPLPVADAEEAVPRFHWLGPSLLGALAIAFLLLGRLSNVPFTRSLGASALVLTASLLTPVKPYDGAFITNRVVGLVLNLALLGFAILLFLGVL